MKSSRCLRFGRTGNTTRRFFLFIWFFTLGETAAALAKWAAAKANIHGLLKVVLDLGNQLGNHPGLEDLLSVRKAVFFAFWNVFRPELSYDSLQFSVRSSQDAINMVIESCFHFCFPPSKVFIAKVLL